MLTHIPSHEREHVHVCVDLTAPAPRHPLPAKRGSCMDDLHKEPQETSPHDPITALAALPAGTILNTDQLAQIFGRHPSSIRRAVQRGELPSSVPLLDHEVWTVEVIRAHLAQRLKQAAKAHAVDVARVTRIPERRR